MKVIITGSSGMIGSGVLLECLEDNSIKEVLVINRTSIKQNNAKLKEILLADMMDFNSLASQLAGYDACFYCLGISSLGINEEDYTRITFDYTRVVAESLLKYNPGMVINFISGAGTQSNESGSQMWARVKGKAENLLLNLPFKRVYLYRPGIIQPLKGISSKTKWYNTLYKIINPLFSFLKYVFPNQITTTENVGKAMIYTASSLPDKIYLENSDINYMANKYDLQK